MTEFALPLPMDVIGELVGVPAVERAGLQPIVRAAAQGDRAGAQRRGDRRRDRRGGLPRCATSRPS